MSEGPWESGRKKGGLKTLVALGLGTWRPLRPWLLDRRVSLVHREGALGDSPHVSVPNEGGRGGTGGIHSFQASQLQNSSWESLGCGLFQSRLAATDPRTGTLHVCSAEGSQLLPGHCSALRAPPSSDCLTAFRPVLRSPGRCHTLPKYYFLHEAFLDFLHQKQSLECLPLPLSLHVMAAWLLSATPKRLRFLLGGPTA